MRLAPSFFVLALLLLGCKETAPSPLSPQWTPPEPDAAAPATASHASVEEVAMRLMRAAVSCDRTAALADVSTAEDAHEVMTRELDRSAVDEETAHFLDKQCKHLGGKHHGEIVDAHLDGKRHLSLKTESYLLRDVDIVAVTVTVRTKGKPLERVTLHFFETTRGWRFTPRP
jgi:hypothetical protein